MTELCIAQRFVNYIPLSIDQHFLYEFSNSLQVVLYEKLSQTRRTHPRSVQGYSLKIKASLQHVRSLQRRRRSSEPLSRHFLALERE